MFVDLPGKTPVLPPYVYASPAGIIRALPNHVIGPADREAPARRTAMERLYAEAAARRARW
jgi:hypothetical protein